VVCSPSFKGTVLNGHSFLAIWLMQTLFSIEPTLPEGFTYTPDFISEAEEAALLDVISRINLHTFLFQGYEAKRKVASFGWDWSFEKQILSKGKDIPHEFSWLAERVSNKAGIAKNTIGELLVTEYPIDAVINWHRDAPPFELIAGISLKTDCIFRLRPHDKKKQGRGSIISFPVKKRSLYIMQGPAREQWEHSIQPVKDVRYSVTLRTLKA
jgi:alkylated DNA repair dioxygenase AlkB